MFITWYAFGRQKNSLAVTYAESIEQTGTQSALPGKAYITGQVVNPGVYELEPGDRLENLIERAGGLTFDADTDGLNLAELISDEQSVNIPKKGESAQTEVHGAKININSAGKNELMLLPGIGEKTAAAVIEYREKKRTV